MSNYETDGSGEGASSPADPIGADHRAILEMQAAFCRTMGHPIRLFILHHINDAAGEVGSSQRAAAAGITRATLSQHLSKMASAGLVKTRREGKFVYVRLAREEIGQACELVHHALQSELRQRANLVQGQDSPEESK